MEQAPHDSAQRDGTPALSRRRFLRQVGAALGLAAGLPALAGCGAQTQSPAAGGAAAAHIFRLSHSHVEGNTALDTFAKKFKERVAARTGGQVEIQIFANNVLGQEKEIVQQVQQGLVDLMASGSAIWGSVAPQVQVLDLPFLWNDYAHVAKAVDGEPGKLLAQHLESTAKARPLAWFTSFGFRNVVTRQREVTSPDDLRGLKLRTIQSPIYVKAMELMGANPTPMALGEVYTSLQTGVIDGYEHDANTTLAQKFFEVSKYIALTQHIQGVLVLNAAPAKIDALPADLRQQVLEAAQEAALFQRGQAPKEDEAALAALKDKGLTVHPIDRTSLAAKAEGFWASYGKELQAEPIVQQIAALR